MINMNIENQKVSNIKDKVLYVGLFLFILLCGIIGFLYLTQQNLIWIVFMVIIGSTCFISLGIFLGYFVSTPYQRAKLKRRITKKNFGVVHIISRGKNILTFVKNFDNDIIWIKDNIYVLKPDRIYKYNDEKNYQKIEPEYIYYNSGVPTIFFDVDNFKPLSFIREESRVSSQELGASCKAWIILEEAKALRWKKTQQVLILIILVCVVISAFASGMMIYEWQKWKESDGADLHKFLEKINNTEFNVVAYNPIPQESNQIIQIKTNVTK
ncbi:MAG: hypothetical protein QXD48_03850 [Candidatus Aenigmatarchaeota archaeon]